MILEAKPSKRSFGLLIWLLVLIVVLSLISAGIGLFWYDRSPSFPFTTVQGQTVQLYGRGLYYYDTVFAGAASRATDAVTLCLGIPLLLFCIWLYRRGSLRGTLLLLGTLGYFLYIYAGYALGTITYNSLFLVYVVLFSLSLFSFVLVFRAAEQQLLSFHSLARLPQRAPAFFLFGSGIFTAFVWLSPLIVALIQRTLPATLSSYYTGRVTDALDLGIIVPATCIAGRLILRRIPLGYVIALSLLVLEIILLPLIVTQTVFQIKAGVSFSPGEIVGPIVGFITLGLLAFAVTFSILKPLSDSTPAPPEQSS